jgi:hypothetical protein
LDPVYRSAKSLREQLKVGVTLAEFNRLRGNFATELSVIKDRMQAQPKTARLLGPYFSAYSTALDAYSLVGDVWEYRTAWDACTGPEPEYSSDAVRGMPLSERIQRAGAYKAWLDRWLKCTANAGKARAALNQRSEQLNTQCGSEVDFDCIVQNADRELAAADKLLMQH